MAERKLLDQVRDKMRLLHFSIRTEEACQQWIKRFILFHNKTHPRDPGGPEISAFLAHSAIVKHVSALTQNQALAIVLIPDHASTQAVEFDWIPALRPE